MSPVKILAGMLITIGVTRFCPAARPYYIDDLGTLGGTETRGLDINANGEATGRSKTLSNEWHAFFCTTGSMIDLGVLGSLDSWGTALNDPGQVVGWSPNVDSRARAFRWTDSNGNQQGDPGEMVDLGTLGGWTSAAYDINGSGQVVGNSKTAGFPQYDHAFLWTDTNSNNHPDPGEMIDLGTLTGASSATSFAYGINDAGSVVGRGKTGIYQHAFYWRDANSNGVSDPGEMIDLGTLGGTTSWAYDVNDTDQVVGVSSNATSPNPIYSRAFLWSDANGNGSSDPSEMVDLGTLGGDDSTAYGINAGGDVVGWADLPNGIPQAFVYRDGAMWDLNDLMAPNPDWELGEAWGINDAGQIVGTGKNGALTHGFLLTPAIGGDANLDRAVNVGDLGILGSNYGQSGKSWGEGDFNGDGAVNVGDLGILGSNYGAGASGTSSVIPEPITAALLLLGGLTLLLRPRK